MGSDGFLGAWGIVLAEDVGRPELAGLLSSALDAANEGGFGLEVWTRVQDEENAYKGNNIVGNSRFQIAGFRG
jgi:hypothetical protein